MEKFILFFLILLASFGTLVGIVCAIAHAHVLRTSTTDSRATLRRYLKIGAVAGMVVTICILLRTLVLGRNFFEIFAGIGIYKIFFIPSVWLVTYLWPSKRVRRLKERKKRRKSLTP